MSRLDYYKTAPDLMDGIVKGVGAPAYTVLDPKLKALLELRVSQLNGCAFCCDKHSQEARHLGEDQQRLDALPVWRESAFFSEKERAALDWAEALTLVAETHAEDAVYEAAKRHFADRELVEISVAVAIMNFWNRMAVGFRKEVRRRG